MNGELFTLLRDRTVLVTGGAGAIGSNLCSALLRAEAAKVVVVDDLSSGVRWALPEDPRIEFVGGSILDEEILRRAFRGRPEIVYHLAALFANQNSVDHPETDLMVNGLGTLRVLQYAQVAGVERVVYASSGCSVYGKSPLPLREEFLSLDLDTPYQITKMLGELYANYFGNAYRMRIVRTRFFNSFGPGEVPGRYRNVIPNFIYWAMKGQPLPITGTGTETRDWTFVEDIVDALLRAGAMKEAVGEAFNVGGGRETRVIDVADWINEETGNAAGVRHVPRRSWDTKERVLASIDKAGTLLGYAPRTEFRAGLRATIAWFRQHWAQIEAAARF